MRLSVSRCTLLALCVVAPAGYSAFGVDPGYSSTSGDGRSQSKAYNDAISGKIVLTPESDSGRAKPWVSAPINNRYYLRVGGVQAKTKLSGIKKVGATSGVVTLDQVQSTKNLINVAYGYKTDSWRSEFEYTMIGAFHYTNSPALASMNTPVDIDAKITGHVLMLNALWDFDYLQKLIPYAGGGLGVSYGRAVETLSSNGVMVNNNTHSNLGPAGNTMVGLRVRPIDPLILDFGYRYMYLWKGPRMRFEAMGSSPVVKLHPSQWTTSGLSFAITYQF